VSSPAISQTVITDNGDTLICIPQKVAREIIVDLEKGDLCQSELESYLKDIETLNQIIVTKDGQIANLIDIKNNLNGVIEEKNTQVEKQQAYAANLRKLNKKNFYKGIASGTGVGVLIGILIML